MPTYEYLCEEHGRFEIRHRLADWKPEEPCPTCKKPAEQTLTNSTNAEFSTPIVVHVDSSGNVRFPMAGDAPIPQGFEKKELRSIREIESFERRMNLQLKCEAQQHHEREERHFGELRKRLRSELTQRMASMSPAGRDFARYAIEQNNNRKRRPTDAGFMIEILHFDQGNREAYNDARTGWKRKHF